MVCAVDAAAFASSFRPPDFSADENQSGEKRDQVNAAMPSRLTTVVRCNAPNATQMSKTLMRLDDV